MEQILTIGTIFGLFKIVLLVSFLFVAIKFGLRFYQEWQVAGDKSILLQKSQRSFFGIALMALLLASLFYIEPILLRPQSKMVQANEINEQVTQTLEERANVEIPSAQYDGELENLSEDLSTIKEDFKELEPVEAEKEKKPE